MSSRERQTLSVFGWFGSLLCSCVIIPAHSRAGNKRTAQMCCVWCLFFRLSSLIRNLSGLVILSFACLSLLSLSHTGVASVCRLNRMLRVSRFQAYFKEAMTLIQESDIYINTNIVRLIYLSLSFMSTAHWAGCLFFAVTFAGDS